MTPTMTMPAMSRAFGPEEPPPSSPVEPGFAVALPPGVFAEAAALVETAADVAVAAWFIAAIGVPERRRSRQRR